jgi:hypothetical protein
MNCPHGHDPSLVETMTKGGVLVDIHEHNRSN